jgi:isoleucyl-tRNA synthetase
MSEHQKNHAEQEKDVLDYWDDQNCFQKSIDQRPEGKLYTFYDGPPFATGMPHYGHIVGGTMKDVVPRFWTMKGFRVERKWGWDCHGLPIENIVEKKFDLKSKKDIEKLGVAQFNDRCHAEVMTYAEGWKKVVRRMGRWVDVENDYKTMDLKYMESIWWVFKSLYEKEMIYEGYKSMHICPRCETALSNFEVNQGYEDITDISVTAKFKVTSGEYKDALMLAWTTTPWTLPGNALIAIGAKIEYVIVDHEEHRYIVARDQLAEVFEGKEYDEVSAVVNTELTGSAYEPLFPYFKDHENAFRIVTADFVEAEGGTGIVHVAPAYGEDDKNLGERENVEPIFHVKMNGHFVPEVAEPLAQDGYEVLDRPVKAKGDSQGVDIEIIKALAHAGKLFTKKKLVHSYPHCWRCNTPLLNYATGSWFVRVEKIRDRLVETNKEIHWVPGNMKEGRFGKWLEGARDWAISRSRYWGAPLPIWRSEDGDIICIGSIEELEQLTGKKVDNLHKHIVDELKIEKDGKTYTRIPEVLDCWFESGSMPYAQLHYPFENKEAFDHGFPAEFIAEGDDQTRGWFYTLHVLANALFDMPAYKNVVVNGIILAEDGKKMSKSLQNYPDPMEVMNRYGADAMRYYLMSSPVVRAENLRFNEKEVADVGKKFINIMRNVSSFYGLYKEHDDGRAPLGAHVLDAWILARLNETLKIETEAMEEYDLQTAARVLQGFVTDFSTWYIRRSRDRMKEEGEDRLEALATMRHTLETFSKMLAPFMPHLSEIIYQDIEGGFLGSDERNSVHLEYWPEAGETDQEIIDQMGEARAIVSRALDIREEAGRAVKQALASITIKTPAGKMDEELLQVILDEVNIKTGTVEKGELAVEIDLELTPELLREGMTRDVIRRVNGLRKEADLTIKDRIDLKVWSQDEDVAKMFEEYRETLISGTLASSITFEKDDAAKNSIEFRAAEKDIWIGF